MDGQNITISTKEKEAVSVVIDDKERYTVPTNVRFRQFTHYPLPAHRSRPSPGYGRSLGRFEEFFEGV